MQGQNPQNLEQGGWQIRWTHFRDTLFVLSAIESCPCDPARIFTLQKERFGLAALETEDLAVTTDVKFSL